MPLLTLEGISLSFGHVSLFDKVQLQIEPGERIALIGRNGTGKSTLLRIITNEINADDGLRWQRSNLRIGYLAQDEQLLNGQSVYDVVAGGLEKVGKWLAEYEQAAHELAANNVPKLVQKLTNLQQTLETNNGWLLKQRIATVLDRLQLDANSYIDHLSGGVKRRVWLARALVCEPDLLLLDEPTNHLDIEAISWLEEFLLKYTGALLFISHDRTFVQNLATRIIELDRGVLTSWPGDLDHYLKKKADLIEVEATHLKKFDKKLAEEEAWIRQGIKARRKRNQGRVRTLLQLRQQRAAYREQIKKTGMKLDSGDLSGKLVLELDQISHGFEGRNIINNFSSYVMRGDRIGIIGANGSGKTTLLRIMLGELSPQYGQVRIGTRLKVAYFDQQRSQLDLGKTVLENLNLGTDHVTINGRSRHVIGYLKDFLFPPQRVHSPVKSLSGGERNRLLLARLFTQPANLLVLDEPTNDLDVETLELLEELLNNFDGTILLVCHDRAFVDNVVTSLLVFENDGLIKEYVGGYADNKESMRLRRPTERKKSETKPTPQKSVIKAKKKLSYKEQRQLGALPGLIEQLEAEQQKLREETSNDTFYKQSRKDITKTQQRLNDVDKELEQAYAAWQELEKFN